METYSLPEDTHVLSVHLQVADLERALLFYRDLAGFKEVDRGGGKAYLSASGQPPALIQLSELPGARPKPPRTTGLYHVAVRLPSEYELGRLLRRLQEQEWPLQGAADHHVSAAVYTADPDGNGLEFYADRPRETWRQMDGSIQMATEPLQLRGALAKGLYDETTWRGIAAGTDIGHVHLHVSDLEKARAFYHDRIGLDVTQDGYPGALFLSAGGYHHHVGLNIWAGRGAPPPPPDSVGLLSFTLEIPNAEGFLTLGERLRAGGIPVEVDDGRMRVRDPDGNLLVLACDSRQS
jgi:catechol 2,3-dioxygenase